MAELTLDTRPTSPRITQRSREMDLYRAARLALRRKYYEFLRGAKMRPSPLSPIEAKVDELLAKFEAERVDEAIGELRFQRWRVEFYERAAGGAS